MKFITENKENPFYLQLEFNAVHTPLYKAPEQLEKKYGIPHRAFDRHDAVWDLPFWDPNSELSYDEWYHQYNHIVVMDPYGRKIYLSHLELMDQVIGNIIQTLKKLQLYENTLIVFSSDNGGSDQSYANNGDLNVYKYCLMEGGIKVPMIFSWPAKIKSTRIDAVTTHRDIFATLSEVVGIRSKNKLDGKSLLPLIHGEIKELHDQPLIWDSGPKQQNWVVRNGDWKMVYRKNTRRYRAYQLNDEGLVANLVDKAMSTGLQLYDLANDPGERHNLADQYPEKVAAMTKHYQQWRSKMSDPIPGHRAK